MMSEISKRPSLRLVPVPPDPEAAPNALGQTVAYVYEGEDHVGDICDISPVTRKIEYEGHFFQIPAPDEWESWRGHSVDHVLRMMQDAS